MIIVISTLFSRMRWIYMYQGQSEYVIVRETFLVQA